MALPFSFSSELKWSSHRNSQHGPFENGTDLYAVLHDRTAFTLEVWRSTDGGDSWTEQDAANHKGTGTAAVAQCYAVQDGATLHIAYGGSGTLAVVPFSMATNTFGTVVSTALAPANNIAGNAPIQMARRSDGDYIILHNGASEAVMATNYRRVKYSRYEAGAWTASTDVAGLGVQAHYDARAVILGSSDRTHFFYTDTTNGDFKHRSLTSANVLGTIQDIDATANVGNYSAGLPVLNGSEVVIPYVDSTGDLNVARATSADTPTWSITQVVTTTNDPETANANPGATAVDSGTVHVFWPNDTDQDIYQDNDGGTGTWGTDVEWKDAVTCQGINITKITNAIGVLYEDGGTVKYDAYSLGAPPPAALAARRTLLGVGI